MSPSTSSNNNIYLIWGANGWIGSQLTTLLRSQQKTVHTTTTPIHEQSLVRETLTDINPTHVINCAGKTGRPTVDWCETHRIETLESNAVGTLLLTHECHARNIHLTVMATGCIYTSSYNTSMSTLTSRPFLESDAPNFTGSFYSATKAPVESLLSHYPHCLILRLRMPVSEDLHPRSFVSKILAYEKVVDIPNSHSLLPFLLPVTVALAEHRETGVYNFTNPGAISHNEVLGLYREIVDPGYEWENFTLEEQGKVILAERSNCALDTGKLEGKVAEYRKEGWEVEVPEVREGYRRCFEGLVRMRGGVQQRGGSVAAAAKAV